MERDTNQRPQRDEPFRFALDYDDREDTDGHWEDGHRSGAFTCVVCSAVTGWAGEQPVIACVFLAAAVICACLPRWRRH